MCEKKLFLGSCCKAGSFVVSAVETDACAYATGFISREGIVFFWDSLLIKRRSMNANILTIKPPVKIKIKVFAGNKNATPVASNPPPKRAL